MTPAGYIAGLASPEPDTGIGKFLVSRLQNHDEAGTQDTHHDFVPTFYVIHPGVIAALIIRGCYRVVNSRV